MRDAELHASEDVCALSATGAIGVVGASMVVCGDSRHFPKPGGACQLPIKPPRRVRGRWPNGRRLTCTAAWATGLRMRTRRQAQSSPQPLTIAASGAAAGWAAAGERLWYFSYSLTSPVHPTPVDIATPIDPSSRTVVTTVTSHSRRFMRNIGRPISRIEPKKSTRYGTRMS
jgi:hypothetical protein